MCWWKFQLFVAYAPSKTARTHGTENTCCSIPKKWFEVSHPKQLLSTFESRRKSKKRRRAVFAIEGVKFDTFVFTSKTKHGSRLPFLYIENQEYRSSHAVCKRCLWQFQLFEYTIVLSQSKNWMNFLDEIGHVLQFQDSHLYNLCTMLFEIIDIIFLNSSTWANGHAKIHKIEKRHSSLFHYYEPLFICVKCAREQRPKLNRSFVICYRFDPNRSISPKKKKKKKYHQSVISFTEGKQADS